MCFIEHEVDTMASNTILYLSERATGSNSVVSALQATGCEVVSTHSSAQAIALLFLMHSVAAVVLTYQMAEPPSLDVVRSLRAIRSDVSIVLLCDDQIDCVPSGANACVKTCANTGQPLEKLTSTVRRLISEDSARAVRRSDSSRQAA